jgi:chaperone required for assembly of F1-ATPase
MAREPGETPPADLREHARRELLRRFYRDAGIAASSSGHFVVQLDGRSVRTPARRELALPVRGIAEMVAAEFSAQHERIDPATMPVTRLVNSALDGVEARRQEVIDEILRYAASDLLCYRAEGPETLCRLQDEAWNPVLQWAEEALGARFRLAAGIVHVPQPQEAIDALADVLARHASPLSLAAIHSMTTITGSALLAIAVAEQAIAASEAWAAAHVDEDWNIAQWGEDAEAMRQRKFREAEMMAAARVLEQLRGA